LKAGDVIEGAQISILFLQLADDAVTPGPGGSSTTGTSGHGQARAATVEQGSKATVQTRAA
ncbi:MAG TPA: hypothetical protein VMJ11_19120, partial [Paraburkholderia sp.]|uniref:hypothetical protein n=1 Tax=Paraburkholderia sp. TaxID=1926495 RepID=UPI002C8EED19